MANEDLKLGEAMERVDAEIRDVIDRAPQSDIEALHQASLGYAQKRYIRPVPPPSSEQPDNPKKAFGDKKPGPQYVPDIAYMWLAIAMTEGAKKYGPFNWRDIKIETGTYQGAIRRHLMLYCAGEDVDPKTGIHHLAYLMAGAAILLDAESTGNLIDTRKYNPELIRLLEAFSI